MQYSEEAYPEMQRKWGAYARSCVNRLCRGLESVATITDRHTAIINIRAVAVGMSSTSERIQGVGSYVKEV